jgi:xanthine dehydrogenase accessory factor
MREKVLRALLSALEQDQVVVLATVVSVEGASPAALGARMLIWSDGRTLGSVGGGALEEGVVAEAQTALSEGTSRMRRYVLREQGDAALGMLCGGEVQVFVEVHRPPPRLLLVGGGNVGQPLAQMARAVGFRVDVVDVDPGRGSHDALQQDAVSEDTYVVIMTADAAADEAALRQALGTPAAYVGMIGSRRKAAIVFERLRGAGFSEAALGRVRAPIGLDLGGRTPAEIALAVLAEMVAVRYGGSAQPLAEIPPDAQS